MDTFLPHYLEYDYDFPTSYDYTFRAFYGLFELPFHWTNIHYGEPELDIADTTLTFENNSELPYLVTGGNYW
jgi:hypothetical protein